MSEKKAKLAFEILARENSRMLTAYLRTVVADEAVIDDLFQEAMIVAWRRLDECDLSRPFGPWLRGIASRLVLAHYRKPMTIAVMGIDNADPKTGMEYANTNIGDGGLILKPGDGTVTNANWKAKKFSWGPLGGDTKNGKPPTNLDWLNGHKGPDGKYHYHATKTYPYLNGGFYGEVVQRGGQVDPQPRAQGVRPALSGLRGAKITGFDTPRPGTYSVRYDVFGEQRSIEYTVAENGSAKFNFVSPKGTTIETYTPRQRGGDVDNAEPPSGQDRSPRGDQRMNERGAPRRGGGDPIIRAINVNGDGQIDKTELNKAAESLRVLDKNNDGQITGDELRGPGGRQGDGQRNVPPGQAGGARGPQPGDGPRQPWILVHADEVDLNGDSIISRDEIVGEASKAFAGYDSNDDGKVTANELAVRGGVRRDMGGFLKGHTKEIDRDQDDVLSRSRDGSAHSLRPE